MASVHVNGIDVEYEQMGAPGADPMLLVHGLGMQLVHWDERFCRQLADHGFRVIRYDNRDVGLSTHFHDGPIPDLFAALGGDSSTASYTIEDMADDGAALLDALGIAAAHVVGVSMGGMIAQALAIRHPEKVLSLASISSTTGERAVGGFTQTAIGALMMPPPQNPEDAAAWGLTVARALGSPAYPPDEAHLREVMELAFERSNDPMGAARQAVAILTAEDRTPGLREVRVPTLVMHGDVDPLVDISGGRATAAAIPGAELVVLPGLGHDLPAALFSAVAGAIVANADKARQPAR
jgi:pimeloyl-ACP methyl ester carboxylesterase